MHLVSFFINESAVVKNIDRSGLKVWYLLLVMFVFLILVFVDLVEHHGERHRVL